jgi:AmmeMemoRadiSam system protein B
MNRNPIRLSLYLLLTGTVFFMLCDSSAEAQMREPQRVREPIGAGRWYPPMPDELRGSVEKLLKDAQTVQANGRIVACVAPHAAFDFSGPIAASAFKPLQKNMYDRVIVLAPSHFASFRGCSLPAVQCFRTPMGDVPLDGPAIRRLTLCTLIQLNAVAYDKPNHQMIHEQEHAIEAVLPFLQAQLGDFKLVPILVGEFLDYRKKPDINAIKTVSRIIGELMDDRTLLVVSTDLTHYGTRYDFTPFIKDPAPTAKVEAMDLEVMEILRLYDRSALMEYCGKKKVSICGKLALAIMMDILPEGARGIVTGYDQSAKKTNKTDNFVGYGGMVFYMPGAPYVEKPKVDEDEEKSPVPVVKPTEPEAIPPQSATDKAPKSE